jgi:hypothetical protein
MTHLWHGRRSSELLLLIVLRLLELGRRHLHLTASKLRVDHLTAVLRLLHPLGHLLPTVGELWILTHVSRLSHKTHATR